MKKTNTSAGQAKKDVKHPYRIIRAASAGVFAGNVQKLNTKEATVLLNDCRRLWYWKGAATLSQLAMDGVSKPNECKFSVPTNGHLVLGVIEVIPCSTKARAIIKAVPEWRA